MILESLLYCTLGSTALRVFAWGRWHIRTSTAHGWVCLLAWRSARASSSWWARSRSSWIPRGSRNPRYSGRSSFPSRAMFALMPPLLRKQKAQRKTQQTPAGTLDVPVFNPISLDAVHACSWVPFYVLCFYVKLQQLMSRNKCSTSCVVKSIPTFSLAATRRLSDTYLRRDQVEGSKSLSLYASRSKLKFNLFTLEFLLFALFFTFID